MKKKKVRATKKATKRATKRVTKRVTQRTGMVVHDIPRVLRDSKSNLFCIVFETAEEKLSLYNAVNGTDYDNPEDLITNTLGNAIYMNMKNDISFLIDGRMNLYEHQSTICPNMPLRDLSYVSRLYEKEIRDSSIYSTKQVRIPAPKFVVFYNGMKDAPERQVLKLSDAYLMEEDDPDLELKVTVLNINKGKNKELLDKCKTLRDYMIYVDLVREYSKNMPLQEAVERAVQECIREGVLAEFLKKYRSEAVAMTIFEYDEEEHMKLIAEEAKEEVMEEANRKVEEADRKREEAERELTELRRQIAELQGKIKSI